MKKINFKKGVFASLSIGILVLSACGNTTPTSDVSTSNESSSVSVSTDKPSSTSTSTPSVTPSIPPEQYYDSIDTSLSGSSLSTALHNLMISTHAYYTSYGDLRYIYGQIDPDSSTPGNLITFYSQRSISSTWDSQTLIFNREHIWPKASSGGLYSKMDNYYQGAGSDLFHVRPEYTVINSNRGDTSYGTVTGSYSYLSGGEITTETKLGSVCEPQDAIKGDVARILLYQYLHYYAGFGKTNSYTSTSYTLDKVVSAGGLNGALALMIKWNLLDPVSDIETARNTFGYSYQHNRNPFIDHPEYACKIWGNVNSDAVSYCS